MLLLSNTNEADLFTNIPQEIIIDILSRLRIGSIIRCKCVCKSWHNLIKSPDFVATHHPKSTGLAFVDDIESSKVYKICDEVGVDGFSTIFNFVLPTHHIQHPILPRIKSSADGLLLLFDVSFSKLFICNPITREYIELPPPVCLHRSTKFGFGASKVSGQYKVVAIFNTRVLKIDNYSSECTVYTLGTGSWRRIAVSKNRRFCMNGAACALLNGNLHWLEYDYLSDHVYHLLISCFDLETEQFTFFSLPPRHYAARGCWLSALEGRLYLCSNVGNDDQKIVIWSMNKYGDEKSWTKEFIINQPSVYPHLHYNGFLFPVKVFRDSGDMLLGADSCGRLFFYSKKRKTIQEYVHLQVRGSYSRLVVNYTPSFLSLKNLGFQNVSSL